MDRRLRVRGLLDRQLGSCRRMARSSSREEGRRLDPELAVEPLPCRAIHLERVGLPPGSVEGSHERADETLVQRMRADERLQLGDELGVAAERKVGLDSPLQRREAGGLEPLSLRLRERVVGELGQGFAPPEAEGVAEQPACFGRLGPLRLADQLARSGAGRARPESSRMR